MTDAYDAIRDARDEHARDSGEVIELREFLSKPSERALYALRGYSYQPPAFKDERPASRDARLPALRVVTDRPAQGGHPPFHGDEAA